MQFADKTTLGQVSISKRHRVHNTDSSLVRCLGTLVRVPLHHALFSGSLDIPSDGTHIDQNQFNWLNTAFYLFFLGFEYPQNLALQYLPVGKWMR